MWIYDLALTIISQAVILYVTDCLAFLVVRSYGHEKVAYLSFALLFGLMTAVLWYNLYEANSLLLLLITLLLAVSAIVSEIQVNGGAHFGRRSKKG